MKTEFTDISETQKTISIEIPTEIVDAEIDRVARGYTKQARLPGFRPGKVPPRASSSSASATRSSTTCCTT